MTGYDFMLVFEHERLPFGLSDAVPLAFFFRLVIEFASFVVNNVVSSNENVFIKPQHVIDLPVDFESNVYGALCEEDHFLNFIKLLENNLVLLLDSRLQSFQQVEHEVPIAWIIPLVESRLVWDLVVPKTECSFVLCQKIFEQEIFVHHRLGVDRKLLENGHVGIGFECPKFVFAPSVFEMVFNFKF